MKIGFVDIRNFRKLKNCRVVFSGQKTVFVGANNSGKTSAMDALMAFMDIDVSPTIYAAAKYNLKILEKSW